MKLYALFGNPVSHSLSPRMHNLSFKSFGINAVYLREKLIKGEDLKKRFEELALSGANITVPHKEIALSSCDEIRGIALDIKAINTIVKEGNSLIGYNTDAPGFLRALKSFSPPKSALILGAGGTARALAHALRSIGIEPVLLNRSKRRLNDFVLQGFTCFTHSNFTPSGYDIIINTTSAGLNDESFPAPEALLGELLTNAKGAMDVIYGHETPFLKKAKECKVFCKDGESMLLYQGVIAFNLFHNKRLNETKIEEAMLK
ncbi:MAG: shikimate dehydrogenase, partial [Campylobacteraceae bacterium]|nr:shikimate dehydrogenase [Campylobacteraceae bacterium]